MKIIKENLLLAFLVSFILIVSSISFAEETNDWESTKYDFRWMHVPVVCGTSPEIIRYLSDNEFVLENISLGREGAKETGNPSYFVAYYINKKGDESVAAITSPTGHETCMMYRSFDLMKPGDKV
jgi:hypothetical protein